MRKKRILYNSDYSKMLTGFGKVSRNLLRYLHSTGKYDIFEYAQAAQWSNPELEKMPWMCRGTIPDSQQEIEMLNREPLRAKKAVYGDYNLERAVREFKPDICIFNQDTWGNTYGVNMECTKNTVNILWTTHDSLPIFEDAFKDAEKTKHYWNWADFATKEFHKKGLNHVRTQYPPLNLDEFFPLPESEILEIKKKFKLENHFIIGFVFRNQLRKLVPNLLEGFALFKKNNPSISAKLLLVTNFNEGWNIPKLASQYGVDMADILTVYVSKTSNNYLIHQFIGQDVKCPYTGKEKDWNTISITKGVSEEQLNEIYNVMSVYCHPATSGGCEIPCVEAASSGKVIITGGYSYGEDIIEKNKAAMELEYTMYREFGTEFMKSNISPYSIFKQLSKFVKLKPSQLDEKQKLSRKWALDNYSFHKICPEIEKYIDSIEINQNSEVLLKSKEKNPNYIPKSGTTDEDFILELYNNILMMDEPKNGEGFKHWIEKLRCGMSRENIYNFFCKVARDENANKNKKELSEIIEPSEKKKLLLVLKESIGDNIMFTSLLPLISKKYQDHDIYIACEKSPDIYLMNPYVKQVLMFHPAMDNELAMIGVGSNTKYFDTYINVAVETQKFLNYLSKIK